MRAKGEVGVFNWSFMVNKDVDLSEFLNMPNLSRGVTGNENVSAGRPSGL